MRIAGSRPRDPNARTGATFGSRFFLRSVEPRLLNKRRGLTYPLAMRIIHIMKSAELIRELAEAGWTLDRVRGSHQVFRHSERSGHVTVPHPKKDLGKGLVRAIRKQAGLER